MISRRHLLTGLSMLPLAGGVMGCAARATTVTAGGTGTSNAAASGGGATQIPTVGPGARWTGAALSGGTPPTDPVRTTAKPAVQWWQPSEVRMSSDIVIGVDADAKGGVAYVDFWVEGNVQRVTQSLYTDTDINGNTRKRLGYWITLNSSAFKIVSTSGSAQIFATATPNDTSMQARTIGNPAAAPGGFAGGTNGDRKMVIYPRATAYDFAANVGVGQTYTNLNAAIAAIKTAISTDPGGGPVQAAQLSLTDSAFYELANAPGAGAGTGIYTGAKGFHVIKAANGVNATIGRAVFPSGGPSTFPIDPMMECLEFQGSGVTVDFRNFTALGSTYYARGHRFNGCNITNSIGTRDSLYWNKGQLQGQPGSAVPGYTQDCTITYVSQMMIYQVMATGNKAKMVGGHSFTGTHFAANNYEHDHTAGFFRNGVLAMTIAYSGAGAATLSKTGSSDGGSLVLMVNGATVKSYTLGQIASDQWFNISSIVNDINSNVAGWSATLIDDTRRASALLGQDGKGGGFGTTNGFTSQPVSSTPLSLYTWFDQHCDILQMYTGGGTGIRENILHRGNAVVGIGNIVATGGWNNTGTKTFLFDSNLNDVVLTDSIFSSPDGTATSQIGGASKNYSNVYMRNLTHEAPLQLGTGPIDGYCVIEQCVLGQIGWATTSGPTPYTFKNCFVAYGYQGPGAFTAAPNISNTLFNASSASNFQLSTLCVDPINGNFNPAPGMPVKASISTYDANLNLRAPNDAIGAVALGYPNPTRPF